ncbi:MAG: hypothetical protein L6R41_006191 [Letrouitia leprolyta]|nr:MAG: hypothetical protein L6R41_006191 [Letrouitia leprolyta]
MAWTRLMHVHSGQLESFQIDSLPPFLAVSHTWADTLFPSGISFNEQAGAEAIHRVVSQCFPDVDYCWVDTFCIDQNDADDKKRQIPLMGEIYGKAVAVAIVFKTPIGLTQKRLDEAADSVKDAVEMFREESWKEVGRNWDHGSRRRCLKDAMDCLELFTRSPWATRVWTLQEFVLAKATVWIGQDLVPLRINEELFIALPDVCETLNIVECILGQYSILYQYYRGMVGARLKMIDSTRIMELLGNRTATEAVDEVFGTMAASGVVIEQIDVSSKEEAWRIWWEKAVSEGHVRWALLPPTFQTPDHSETQDSNCVMPSFSARHQASSCSGLDTVHSLGPVRVENGVVTMDGFWMGMCHIVRRLGRIHQDASDLLHRDITLILFAADNWTRALRVARAFGGGRYSERKILIIAQVLKHNFYRAQIAITSSTEDNFRPRFRDQYQQYLWSDFMLLQSVQMMVMNEGVAFLAEIKNQKISADVMIVMESDEQPKGRLLAVDFGAKTTSGRTLLTVLEVTDEHFKETMASARHGSPSLHKIGVTAAVEITSDIMRAKKYSALSASDSNLYTFSMGGRRCIQCRSGELTVSEQKEKQQPSWRGLTMDEKRKRAIKVKMRRQNHAIKGIGRRKESFGGIRKRGRQRVQVKMSSR